MRAFLVTSEAFIGEIEYVYDDLGRLSKFDIRATLDQKKYEWILNNIPISPEVLLANLKKVNALRVLEVLGEVTFEVFWQRYANKGNSSKKRANMKWNRMVTAEQIKAYRYLDTYFCNIKSGTEPKHVETYLNAELWNN